jgi:hypothetical protein
MRLSIYKGLFKRAILWVVPLGLLAGTSMYAQWNGPYGYGGDDHAMRHHQWHEREALREHQRQERYYYGDSWELRQHQKEERHELRHHEREERRYGDPYGYSRGYSHYDRDDYDRRY